jgi:hypothetical protein
MRTIRQLLFADSLPMLLGKGIAALSVMAILKFAFQSQLGFPLSLPFNTLLDVYDESVQFALSLIEPWILEWVRFLSEYFAIDLSLSPVWRHISVLVGLYLSRSVWIAFGNDFGAALFRLVVAPILALLCGVAAGLVPWTEGSRVAEIAIGALPVLTLFFYGSINGAFAALFRMRSEIGRRPHLDTRMKIFLGHVSAAWSRTWKGLVILVVGVELLSIAMVVSPGVVMTIFLAFVLGLYFMNEGVSQAKRRDPSNWVDVYSQMDSTKLGASMLGVLLWDSIGLGLDRFFTLASWL